MKDDIVDLDYDFTDYAEESATLKSNIGSCLSDCVSYELWVRSQPSEAKSSLAYKIYYSQLPEGIEEYERQVPLVRQNLGLIDRGEERIKEVSILAHTKICTLTSRAFSSQIYH